MKKVLSIILSVVLLYVGSVIGASAESGKTYHDFSAIYSSSEADVVRADVAGSALTDGSPADCYKVHSMTPAEFRALASGRAQDANMSDNDEDLRWYIFTDGGNIAQAQKINGKWTVTGSTVDGKAASDGALTPSVLNEHLSAMPSDAFCVDVPEYHTSFIVFSANDETCVLPFGSRPDLTGLDNGKEYTAREAAVILSKSFGKASGGLFGGASGRASTVAIVIAAAVAVVGAAFAIVFFSVRRRKRTVSA